MKKEDLDEHQAILDETCKALEQAHKNQNDIEADNFAACDSIIIDSMMSGDQHSSDAESIEALARELNRHYSEYNENR